MTTSYSPPPLTLRVRLKRLWRRFTKTISPERRGEVRVILRNASLPGFDFFLLVILSSVIATSGLLMNSPATIIGAMLVAPLMSPIIGLGLGSITGDSFLVKNATSALGRGAFLAILISFLLTWGNQFMPFIILQVDLPAEVIARTHPSPIDLTVALAGGLAAAYALAQPHLSAALPGVAIATALMPPLCTVGIGLALGRWDVAGGALLLFVTNAVTITFSAMLVFFTLGFNPKPVNGTSRVPGSLLASALFTGILFIPLSYFSVQFFQSATENRQIEEALRQEVNSIHRAEVIEWDATRTGDTLHLNIVLRTITPLTYEDSVALQKAIADRLQRPVAVAINQIIAAHLDPLVPPTFTPTPTETLTPTPGPSPTATSTASPTFTTTPTQTIVPTSTATHTPTSTLTSTPTPALGLASNVTLPGLRMRQWPDGPVIAVLRDRQNLTILYGYEVVNGLVWVEAMDEEGRVGWIPEVYLLVVTPTNTPTSRVTATPSLEATALP
jgi:uncharacterized hydrophobic protein (TIGR00271 family)